MPTTYGVDWNSLSHRLVAFKYLQSIASGNGQDLDEVNESKGEHR